MWFRITTLFFYHHMHPAKSTTYNPQPAAQSAVSLWRIINGDQSSFSSTLTPMWRAQRFCSGAVTNCSALCAAWLVFSWPLYARLSENWACVSHLTFFLLVLFLIIFFLKGKGKLSFLFLFFLSLHGDRSKMGCLIHGMSHMRSSPDAIHSYGKKSLSFNVRHRWEFSLRVLPLSHVIYYGLSITLSWLRNRYPICKEPSKSHNLCYSVCKHD